MTDTRPTDMAAAAEAVKHLRDALLKAGFRHANAVGELVSQDDTTWVSTTFVHGEYSVYAWRRPRGISELGETRHVMRVHATTPPGEVEAFGRRLKRWAKRPPKGVAWPIRGLEPVR